MRHAAAREEQELERTNKRKKHQCARNRKRVRTEDGSVKYNESDDDDGSDLASMIDDDESAERFENDFTSESEAKSTSGDSSDDE